MSADKLTEKKLVVPQPTGNPDNYLWGTLVDPASPTLSLTVIREKDLDDSIKVFGEEVKTVIVSDN